MKNLLRNNMSNSVVNVFIHIFSIKLRNKMRNTLVTVFIHVFQKCALCKKTYLSTER